MNPTNLGPLEQADCQQLRERIAGFTRLLQVTHTLAQDLNLQDILETVASQARKALDCDRVSVYQYDPKTDELRTTVVTDLEINEIRHGMDVGVTGYVARQREIVNVSDPAADPRWNSTVDQQTGYKTRNILAAPLSSPRDGSLLGVLQLLNKNNGGFTPFDEELVAAFSQHAAVALDRAILVEELRKQEATNVSLLVARDVQRGFMPHAMPEVPGYEIGFWWFPHEAVGGDYCDVIALPDGRIGLVMADVSGHGLGPSLLMASVRAALRALLPHHRSPATLLESLNRAVTPDLPEGKFITLVLAELDPGIHCVNFANAGHWPVMHYVAGAGEFTPLEATGMPVGVSGDTSYPLGPPLDMQPGDILFMCTDGIVEATSAEDEPFGEARLRDLIRQYANLSAADLAASIGRAVEEFYHGDNPPDDLTILAARRIA